MRSYDLFRNPANAYRGKPFWSWNGLMDPQEIRRQVRILKDMGMGGAFLHSRVGLETEYLGREWFNAIRAGVDECRKHDMEAWLYDEDRWPSGCAGGLATMNPAHRQRFLVTEIIPADQYAPTPDQVAAWEAVVTGDRARIIGRLPDNAQPSGEPGRVVIACRPEMMPCTSYYNGYTYLDTMSADAVREFIELTHEAYRHEIGGEFGKAVPGIFTDEPNYTAFVGSQLPQGRPGIPYIVLPWTPKLPATFQEMFGYDLIDHLPELALEVEGVPTSKARIDFRNCATHLFVTNFAKQIYDWCEQNSFVSTGHVLLEEFLYCQTLVVGAAMRFYEYMQAPGIDVLTQYNYEYDNAKQCQSALYQTGRKWMLSELYGCTGWDLSFEGHKAVGDWQAALGVTLRCHHLSWYTMKGEAKRDYPASISFQSPWWRHYRFVEDYFSRVNVALTEGGEPVQKLLVIHPIESMFARFRPRILDHDNPDKFMLGHLQPDVAELNNMLPTLRDWLLEAHLDFAYGDEEMMSRLAAVDAASSPRLRVGQATYDAVLVPPLDTVRRSTLALLADFAKAGGRVVFAGDPAPNVDGEPSSDARKTSEACILAAFERDAVLAALEPIRTVSIRDDQAREAASILYQLRRDGDNQILFVCNTDRVNRVDPVTIRVNAKGKVVEYDPVTGERNLLRSRTKGDWTEFSTRLYASGSKLFEITPTPDKGIRRAADWTVAKRQTLRGPKSTQRGEPNVLVLDRPQFRVGDAKRLSGPEEILRVDRAVRDALGAPYRGGEMLQPWARKLPADPPTLPVELLYTFDIETIPQGAVDLAIETPGRFRVALNGAPVNADAECGWWVDPCIRRIPLAPTDFRPGPNVLRLEIDYREDDGLEAVFLLGQFGVRLEGARAVVTSAPDTLQHGDWVYQGLPFYSGPVTYRYEVRPKLAPGRRVVLQAPNIAGTVARVLVDGREAGFLAWDPYEVDLTPFLGEKPAEVAIEVFTSRRNSFGPLHLNDPNPRAIGPGSFVTAGDAWTDAYVVVPSGLLKAPALVYLDRA